MSFLISQCFFSSVVTDYTINMWNVQQILNKSVFEYLVFVLNIATLLQHFLQHQHYSAIYYVL